MAMLFRITEDVPLIGAVSFGLIDRGTNVIQVRPSTSCPLSCIFCSTDAGPCSRNRRAEYLVDLDHMVDSFRSLARIKGHGVEAHIDTVGDPFTYPRLEELVHRLAQTPGVEVVSLQTHGVLMDEKVIDRLDSCGLTRINLSIDAIDSELSKRLAGTAEYDVARVMRLAEYVVKNTRIDLLIAPVWVPPLNDLELDKLIEFARSIGAGKKVPPLGIQKCEFHRHGRRTKEMKRLSWFAFYSKMRELAVKHSIGLILKPSDFGIRPAPRLFGPYTKGEKVNVRVIGPGWLNGESLAVTKDNQRAVTVVGAELPEGAELRVRIVRSKDNILIGRLA